MNRKGFSIIELLAVIVILGIIALIATPIIMGIIEDSRQSSFGSSVNGIKKAIEQDIADQDDMNAFKTNIRYSYGGWKTDLDNANTTTTKKLFRLDAGVFDGPELNLSGSAGGKGIGYVDESGQVHVAIFTDQYCGYIIDGDLNVDKIDNTQAARTACVAKVKAKGF